MVGGEMTGNPKFEKVDDLSNIIHLCNVRFHESNYLSSRKFPIKTK